MKGWSWLLAAALCAAPVVAADKKKEDRKAKEAPAAQAAPPPLAAQPVPQDVAKEAEAKVAAGDADRAFAMLEKAAAGDGRVGLRLGVLRESRGELLLAEDAYKAAAEKLSGAEKGEALGRLKDRESLKSAVAKARSLGYKEPTFLACLQRIEAGEKIK